MSKPFPQVVAVRLRFVAIPLLVAGLLVACAPADTSPVESNMTRHEVPVSLSVSGAVDFLFDAPTAIVETLAVLDQRLPPEGRIFSLRTPEPFGAGGDLVSIGLHVLRFKGDGEYAIAGAIDEDQITANPASALDSGVYFQHVHEGLAKAFALTLSPCTLEVAGGGARGSVECPRLGRPDGEEVRLVLRWGAA